MNRAMRLFSIFLVVLFTGCAATVNKPGADASRINTSATLPTKLVLTVSGTPEMEASSDWSDFCEEWQTSMEEATSSAKLAFAYVSGKERVKSNQGILVQIKVNDYRYVSQAKRYGLGVFTGNAFMDLDVAFVELPSQQKLGARKFSTSSSAWEGVFSAMTPKQVQAVSSEIVNEIAKK